MPTSPPFVGLTRLCRILRMTGRFIFHKGSVMSISVSSSLPSYFSHATMPQIDRRGIAERRVRINAQPLGESEPSWGRPAFVAGIVGVVLGSAGAMAVLAQRSAAVPELTASGVNVEQPVPALSVKAPLLDATPAASVVRAAHSSPGVMAGPTIATTVAAKVEEAAGAESYSEDAAGVPGATYREPPVMQPGASTLPATIAP